MNAKDAWLATLGQLQVQLNRSTYDTWLRRAELLGHEDGRFVVSVPNAYARDWIERHLLDTMTRTLSSIFQRAVELQIIVWNPIEEPGAAAGPLLDYTPEVEPAESLDGTLNPDYTFDNFVIGEANRYAALLAQAVVQEPIGKYSPVYFHGGMGLGKTHLLQAIARGLLARGYSVVYLTAEDFTNEFVATLRGQAAHDFRAKYRKADAVIIDDLQFVEGKESTQAELVATWDALRNRQRAMIFAADRLPRDMARVSQDARSRFQAGPIALLEVPDLKLRRDVLHAKALRRGLLLPPELLDLLAARITSSIRDLESAVEQLHTFCGLTGRAVTATEADMVLKALGSSARQNAVTLDAVLTAIADYYRLSVTDLAGRSRTKIVTQARQLAMYLGREETDASLLQIGDALGGRDHSTVAHGCARIAAALATDQALAKDVAAIRAMLDGAGDETASEKRIDHITDARGARALAVRRG